jgi:hypothetical protein
LVESALSKRIRKTVARPKEIKRLRISLDVVRKCPVAMAGSVFKFLRARVKVGK